MLTDTQKANFLIAFHEFRQTYGRELLATGWNRGSTFGDWFDPAKMDTVDDIPGLLAIYADGGVIEVILPDRLMLRDKQNRRLAWIKGGGLIGGQCLSDYEIKRHSKSTQC